MEQSTSQLVKVYNSSSTRHIRHHHYYRSTGIARSTVYAGGATRYTAVRRATNVFRQLWHKSGLEYYIKRYIINMAPVEPPQRGSAYDLPLAIALTALEGIPTERLARTVIMGELSLDGSDATHHRRATYGPSMLGGKALKPSLYPK